MLPERLINPIWLLMDDCGSCKRKVVLALFSIMHRDNTIISKVGRLDHFIATHTKHSLNQKKISDGQWCCLIFNMINIKGIVADMIWIDDHCWP